MGSFSQRSANTVNWDDEFTLLMNDMFPDVKLNIEEALNSQQQLKNKFDENVDPRNITGNSSMQYEIENNQTFEDWLKDDESQFNPWFINQINLMLKKEIETGELMAEHAEKFGYEIKQLLQQVTCTQELGSIPEHMARIPLLWSLDFLWNASADMLIRNNREDGVKLEELMRTVVAFSTARQFNEALFIDVERSIIWKLKEDLRSSANFGSQYTKELSNIMWAFAVAGEGSSEFWYWIDLYLSKNLLNGDFNDMANVVFALYESGWAIHSKSLPQVDSILQGREMFINNEANDILMRYKELLKQNDIYTMNANFKKMIPKVGPVI